VSIKKVKRGWSSPTLKVERPLSISINLFE